MEYGTLLDPEEEGHFHEILGDEPRIEPTCQLHISDIVDDIHAELDGLAEDMKNINILSYTINKPVDNSWMSGFNKILTTVTALGVFGTIALIVVFI